MSCSIPTNSSSYITEESTGGVITVEYTEESEGSSYDLDIPVQSREWESGFCCGYLFVSEDCYRTIDGKLYMLFAPQTEDARRFTTEEILNLDVGSEFVYDPNLAFTIDRIEEEPQWHDYRTGDENGDTEWDDYYRRRDGRIVVNDTFYFVHPIELWGEALPEEEADKWMLATDMQLDSNTYGAYFISDEPSWIPVADVVDKFFEAKTNSFYDINELCSIIREHCGDKTIFHAYLTIRNNEVSSFDIDLRDYV